MTEVNLLIEQLRKNGEQAQETLKGTETSQVSDRGWTKRLERSGIYRRFWKCSFDEMDGSRMNPEIRKEFDRVKNYAAHFHDYEKKGIGLILIGPVGTMKTSLAVAVGQNLLKRGRSVMFIPMAELFDNLIRMSRQKDPTEFMRFENRLKETSLLILDDLGTEYPGDWIRNKVDAIISYRYNNLKPICITTNLLPGELESRYRERVYDRLKGSSIVVSVAAGSQRRVPEEIY